MQKYAYFKGMVLIYFILRITLSESVELLKKFDLINAINLNGAGAATLVINGTVVNHPSNTW